MDTRVPFPDPGPEADVTRLLLERLDFYRDAVLAKLDSLPDADLRHTRVPSGWTPLEIVWHLAYMERRWLVWGFLAEPVADPWGDHDPEEPGRWVVPPDLTAAQARDAVLDGAAQTRAILETTPLEALAAVGGRFESDPPSLAAIALHVLQEYARHAGHLDIAVELAGGALGE